MTIFEIALLEAVSFIPAENSRLKKYGVIFSYFFLKIWVLTPEKCLNQAQNVDKGGKIISAFKWWLGYIVLRASGFQNGVQMTLNLNKLQKSSFLPIFLYRIDFSRHRPIGIDNYHWKHHGQTNSGNSHSNMAAKTRVIWKNRWKLLKIIKFQV